MKKLTVVCCCLLFWCGTLAGICHDAKGSDLPFGEEWKATYREKGEPGLHDFAVKNKSRLDAPMILEIAKRGVQDKDRELIEISRVLAQVHGEDKTLGDVYLQTGDYHYQASNNLKALEYYENALIHFRKVGDLQGMGNVHQREGVVHARMWDNRKALESYEKALPFFEKADDPVGQGRVYRGESEIYFRRGERRKALKLCEKALPFFEKADDPAGQGQVYRGEAEIVFRMGDYQKGLQLYEKALPFFLKSGNTVGEGTVYQGKADIYDQIGDIRKALELYEKALPLFEKANNSTGKGFVYLREGGVYLKIGDERKALELFGKALPFFEKTNNPFGQGTVHMNMGLAYARIREYPEALSHFAKARALFERAENLWGQGSVYRTEGEAYSGMRDDAKALELFEKALPFLQKASDPLGMGYVYFREGDVYARMRQGRQALERYDKAYEMFRAAGVTQMEAYALLRKARVTGRSTKNAGGATALYEEGLSLLEKVRKQAGFSEIKKTFMENVSGVYEEAAVFMLKNGRDKRGFNIAERMKARIFLDQLAEGLVEIDKGIDPDLKKKRDEIEARLSVLNTEKAEEMQNPEPDGTLLASLQAEIANKEAELEKVKFTIRLKNPLYASVQYPEPITVNDLQKKVLKENEAVLEYLVTKRGVYCFLITAEAFQAVELTADTADLQRKTESFLKDVTTKDRFKESDAIALYEALVRPFESRIGNKTLIIVPDGVLCRLPFEILKVRSEKGSRYLLEMHRVKYVPSASVLGILRAQYKKEGLSDSFVGFGDPVYDYESFAAGRPERGEEVPGRVEETLLAQLSRGDYERSGGKLYRLAGSGEEVQGIRSLFREKGVEATTLLRIDASKKNALRKDMERYGYIHYAAHGVLDDDFQAIALSQIPGNPEDGFLTLNDIMNSRYHARVVVLSACQSGLGKMERGEGVTGLSRAVMYAGSPAVVVSLWNVSDVGTKELMIRFYRNLVVKNLPKEEALRRAKLEMQESGDFRHPYFWSAFVMYGE